MLKSSEIDLESLKGDISVHNVMFLLKKHLEMLEAALPDFHSETFRGQILLLSTRIEFLFGECLDHWFFGENVSKKSGSLANLQFEKQILMLKTVGLLDGKQASALHGLRTLRNDLAHSMATNVDQLIARKDIRSLANFLPFEKNAGFDIHQQLNLAAILLTGSAQIVHNFCTSDAVSLSIPDRLAAFQNLMSKRDEAAKKVVALHT